MLFHLGQNQKSSLAVFLNLQDNTVTGQNE